MTKKKFFEIARTGIDPATITIYADPFPMKYKFIVSITWCGLFGDRLHGTNSKENSEKMQAKYNRWLAEFQKKHLNDLAKKCAFCGKPRHDDMFFCKMQNLRWCLTCFKEVGGCDTCSCKSCKVGEAHNA